MWTTVPMSGCRSSNDPSPLPAHRGRDEKRQHRESLRAPVDHNEGQKCDDETRDDAFLELAGRDSEFV